jgi:predicted Fe-S protein YdhL (DUF1289 family)
MTFANGKTQAGAEPARPASPCMQVCVLDGAGTCTGCGRTVGEIARWSGMSAGEQWAVVRRIEGVGK